MYSWRIFRTRGAPVVGIGSITPMFLGVVEAVNERDAIKKAITDFKIASLEEQNRLIAERRE